MNKLFSIPELELQPTDNEIEMIKNGYYRLSRVDVNCHFAFPSAQLARVWLRSAGQSANMQFRVQGYLSRELYILLLILDGTFQKSILSMTRYSQKIKVIVYMKICYKYLNL